MNQDFLNFSGVLLIFIYLLVILVVFKIYASNKYKNDAITEKYFFYGICFKLIVALGFAYIFDIYYDRGGDSYAYFLNSSRLGGVLFEDPKSFFKMLFGFVNKANAHQLPSTLDYFPYFRDPAKFFTHRLVCLFTIVGLKHFYLTIICMNVVLFLLNWRVFLFFKKLFPEKEKIAAICFLFVPSVTFWGSGIVKDSFTFTFTLLFIIYFYRILIYRKFGIFNILKLLFCVYIIINLKPYILYSALVAGFLWVGFIYTQKVKNRALRVFVFPIAMLVVGMGGMWALNSIMSVAGGAYKDVDSMLGKATSAQYDLKQDYYKGSSFDIGEYDATVTGALSVTPAAILAGLYRPFLWEARSAVMLLSGIENTILILLTIFVFFRAGPVFFFKQLGKEPFLIFCFVYALIMAMGIGLSTSNFGALVRFKIPLIPFFLMGWLIIYSNYKKLKLESIKTEKK